MKAILSRRPSPAMVVAVVALFAGTGGVGYAAATVDSGDIVNNSIRSKDVRNRGLTGTDVKKNSVGGTAIKESALDKVPSAGSADTAQQAASAQNAAAVGPGGVATASLQDGSVTAPKLGTTVIRTHTIQVPNADSTGAELACQPGERILSGGVRWSGNMAPADAAALHTVHSYQVNASTWFARAYNNTGSPRDLTLRVLCLGG
jgi:hypothetical protein